MSNIKYPKQIIAAKQAKKALSVEASLFLPTEEEYSKGRKNPLEMHAGFSVFKLTLLDYSSEPVKTATANIPPNDIEMLHEGTKIALQTAVIKKTLNTGNAGSSDISSPAYTQKLFGNKFGQKTPAEVLMANPADRAQLLTTRDWLEKNKDRYAANASQITAIDDAIRLFDAGKLAPGNADSPFSYTIYDEPCKLPNAKNTDNDGKTRVVGITISYNGAMRYPFCVRILNCQAAPIFHDDGTVQADLKNASNKTELTINLSEREWLRIIGKCSRTLANFEQMNFEAQWRLAEENSYHGYNSQ